MAEHFLPVARSSEVPPGYALSFRVDERRILICNVNGELHAVEDRCTHDDWPLGDSRMRGTLVECPRHGARFDVTDGSVRALPARRALTRFPVRMVADTIEVDLTPITEAGDRSDDRAEETSDAPAGRGAHEQRR